MPQPNSNYYKKVPIINNILKFAEKYHGEEP